MYRKILVPLDGSTFAESALPYALTLSRKAGARVELVSVDEPDLPFESPDWATAGLEWSREYLEQASGRLRAGAGGDVSVRLLEGSVSDALVRYTADSGADLVVMASHGRGAFSRLWLGSVADSFLRRTDRPVLLVRPVEDGPPPDLSTPWDVDSILLPLDGSTMSQTVVEPAVALGTLFGARYDLLRVLSFPAEIASPYLPDSFQMNVELVDEARRSAAAWTEERAVELRAQGLEATVQVVVDAHAPRAILHQAEERVSALIALSTHGRSGMARVVLGSTTDKVIRGSHRPILVIRPPESA